MKNPRWLIFLGVLAVFCIVGTIFCFLRPSYVSEALDILFHSDFH